MSMKAFIENLEQMGRENSADEPAPPKLVQIFGHDYLKVRRFAVGSRAGLI